MKVEGPVLLLRFDICTGTTSLPQSRVLHEGRETCVVVAVIVLLSSLEPLPQGRVCHEDRRTYVVVAV